MGNDLWPKGTGNTTMHAETIPNTSYKFNVQKHKQRAITVHIFLQETAKTTTSPARLNSSKVWSKLR
jgi:hypothetical protein